MLAHLKLTLPRGRHRGLFIGEMGFERMSALVFSSMPHTGWEGIYVEKHLSFITLHVGCNLVGKNSLSGQGTN